MSDARARFLHGGAGPHPTDRYPLVGAVVSEPGRPVECTLYPPHLGEGDIVTHWISAREGSFVALRDCR